MGDLYASCPLDRTRREIRLLTLQPNNDEGIMTCNLRTHSPEDCPPYTALSYTWGADVMHTDIDINGVSFPIRENLWDFLHQQLIHENYGPFWIDAICIQQSEVDERNHQVRMMGAIYSNARNVLVWLGREDEDSDVAMRAFTSWRRTPIWTQNVLPYLFTNEDRDSENLVSEDSSATIWNRKEASSVLSLCKRGYWYRMWIIQEILLARNVDIHCGPKMVKWLVLTRLYDQLRELYLSTHEEMLTPFYNAFVKSGAMVIAKMTQNDVASLQYLLQVYGDHECADIRDKVYALVAVGRYGSFLELDYRKSAKDVLLDVFYLESARMRWEMGWSSDALYRTGRLLEKTLQVPFPEVEARAHLDGSQAIARKNLYGQDGKRPWRDFWEAVKSARTNT